MKNEFGRIASLPRRSRRTLLLVIILVSITIILDALIAVWLITSNNLSTIQAIGLEAYGGDIKFIKGTATLDWGTFYLSESKNVSFYLRSLSDIPIKPVLDVNDWSPKGLAPYITLTWNYTGAEIAPHEEIFVSLKLSLSSSRDLINYLIKNNVTAFSFNIYIHPSP